MGSVEGDEVADAVAAAPKIHAAAAKGATEAEHWKKKWTQKKKWTLKKEAGAGELDEDGSEVEGARPTKGGQHRVADRAAISHPQIADVSTL